MSKLVRDNIPEIMTAQGKNPIIRVLTDEAEYFEALGKKLLEEVHEFLEVQNDHTTAQYELADILEVIDAICFARKFNTKDILEKKLEKRNRNGRFEKRFFLIQKE